ncbi:MAG: filamentous hemagglutinin family protein [Methylomonas sp.]
MFNTGIGADSPRSRLKPLATAIRALVTGGLAMGVGVTPALANGGHPLPENPFVASGTATETLSNNGHTLTIDTTGNTVLDWSNFNIDKGYKVDFEGSAASVVVNEVPGQQAGGASTIAGTITANEQIYLVNPNGIVFAPGSNVSANALVATTLGISQQALQSGIANVFTNALNNTATAVAQGAALQAQNNGQNYLQDSQGNNILDASGNKIPVSIGDITVNAGAAISTNAPGGLILLAAPTINNAGGISAPDGQVILAAAQDKVYLQDSQDPNLRGMLVEVGTGGLVNNTGNVQASTGNVTMIGFAVQQNGIATATTSVALNGSVRLLAEEGVSSPANSSSVLTGATTQRGVALNDNLGTSANVYLGANSLTGVELDTSGATAIAAQAQPQSYVEISGHEVELLSGSLVQAPAGNVNVEALEQPLSIAQATGAASLPATQGTARIYMQTGSAIDVSGVQNVAEPVANNIVSLKLQSNELRNSPLQRSGVLYGQTVDVDTRDATMTYANGVLSSATVPIADITGPVQTILSTIDERSTAGGAINLNSSGDVVINSGGTLNFSGGSVAYQGGDITTTELSSGGQVYNLGLASPNLIYSSVFNQTSYQAGYVQGAAGGNLNINSFAALLDGTLRGNTVTGALQRQSGEWAAGSSVNINLGIDNASVQQDIVFGNAGSGLTLAATDAFPLNNNVQSSPMALNINTSMLNNSGVQNITLGTNGKVTVDAGASVSLSDGGQFKATASDFSVLGAIDAPSGNVNFTVAPSGLAGAAVGDISLGASGQINVSGLWINDWLANQQGQALAPVAINGGSVNLTGGIDLASGSRIHADGGAWKQASGGLTAGKAGNISLNASSAVLAVLALNNSSLTAWGLQQDGSLTLAANDIVIGSQADNVANALLLNTAFFQTGGFSSYTLNSSAYGLTVENNVQLNLVQNNPQLDSSALLAASGGYLANISRPVTLAENLRNPVNLTLEFTGNYTNNGNPQNLTLGVGSLIQTDAGGAVKLISDSSIFADGVINTPAGQIAMTINFPTQDPGYVATQGVWLGADSQLLARGAYVPQANTLGLNIGAVDAGGSITLTADRGYIVTEAGSLIDVSGAAAVVNAYAAAAAGGGLVSENVASAGGGISLSSGEGILADGQFKAYSGGGNAAGGSLSVDLDKSLMNTSQLSSVLQSSFPNLASTFVVTTNNSNVAPTEGAAIPLASADQAWLKSATLNNAGFGSISLKTDALLTNNQLSGAIEFQGNVQLNAGQQIILDSPNLVTQPADNQQISINAPYVALGSSQVNNEQSGNVLAVAAVAGNGQLSVIAQGIDLIGGLSFNGIGQVNLASQGGVRFRGDSDPSFVNQAFLGELNLDGNLNISAERIYPATLTDYTVNVTQTVTFASSGVNNGELLSAGGNLTVNANNIDQQGTLEAPFGSLTLNAADTVTLAAGSVTSVSGAGEIAPFGIASAGSIWEYPLDHSGNNNLVIYDQSINNLPQKMLDINGQYLDLQHGATINLAGGGDLYAYEFIAGNGGSNDVLANTVVNGNIQQFAVIPGVDNILTPYDPQQYTASGLTTMGQSVYLNGADGLAAGWYTILPSHYALLPGAYLITPEAGTSGQLQTTYNAVGDPIVAGYYGVAGTAIQNSLSQGFEVQSGSIFTGSLSYNATGGVVENTNTATSPTQFNPYLASTAIPAMAAQYNNTVIPQLPQDAGAMQIGATLGLTLDASLLASPASGGLGGQVDISANNLQVVGASQDLASLPAGTVGLLASQLNSFNAPSLLIGGKRSLESKGEVLTATAANVTVMSDVTGGNALSGQEILLTAANQVTVKPGAQVLSTAAGSGAGGGTLIFENSGGGSDGALLRVSAGGQAGIERDLPVSGTGGVLNVGSGAILQAQGSMLLDSSQNTVFDGVINMTSGGALALDSSRISIGDAPANTPGLVLASLPANLKQLTLNSGGDVDLYGAVSLNDANIDISAASINGYYGNNGATAGAVITAGSQLELSNSGAVSVHANAQAASGSELELNAQNIQLGGGQYGITGFQNVQFNANQAISGQGAATDPATGNQITAVPGQLNVAGNLDLNAAYFSGGNGATTTINAANNSVTLAYASPSSAGAAGLPVGLGASWTISGGSIDSSALFDLPSGILNLSAASGNLNLNNGTAIDLSGRTVSFASASQYSPGGSLDLTAAQGNVDLTSGASVNLAGALQNNIEQSSAGSLNVQAVNGQFVWNGTIDAGGAGLTTAGGATAGNAQINVAGFGAGGFSALNSQLAAAGFTHNLSLEQQTGDITVAAADTVTASQFQLSADQGAVYLDGTINASGASAGSVSVYGANGVTLAGAIDAYATGAGNAGGNVTLDAVARNGETAGSGVLDLSAAGGAINVSGGNGGNGGSLLLRTGRDDASGAVAVTAINTQITGAAPFAAVLEATRVYAAINAGTANANIITAGNIAGWQTDTANFMNNQANLLDSAGGGLSLPSSVTLMPGIEVRSSGNLTLAANWDFESGGSGWSAAAAAWNSGWRYGPEANLPGFLTLRAAGDLDINASISDAVAATPLAGGSTVYQNMIQPGLSWSYDLIAGGNVNLASSYTDPNTGLDTQLVVRTGTGEINIQSGKDIAFNIDNSGSLNATDDASAVYTLGTTALFNTSSSPQQILAAYPNLPAPTSASETLLAYLNSLTVAQQNQILRYGMLPQGGIGSTYQLAEYPTAGGNVSLNAGGNIQGQQTGEQIADWLVASGKGSSANSYTSWGIDISGGGANANANNNNFNQNVGALGGGNVTVQAGGNINDLSVMIPNTGKPLGDVASYGRRNAITWTQSDTLENGGGNLQMTAGNNIAAGEYYVASGTANLTAGGGFIQDSNNPSASTIGAILDVGAAVFNLQARNDVQLETAMNPTVLLSNSQSSNGGTVFFSYGAESAVNLSSSAGNVVFLNNTNNIAAMKNLSSSGNAQASLTEYPGILHAAALSGDLRLDNSMNLFPSVAGSLQLLANGNIGIDPAAESQLSESGLALVMSDISPSLLPSIQIPFTSLNADANFNNYSSSSSGAGLPASSQIPLGSQQAALIVANSGNIAFPAAINATVSLPTAANVVAGGNIDNVTLSAQNQSASDVTLVQAGASINYDTQYNSNGLQPVSDVAGVTVAGPGVLQVIAGRNINLGSSLGIGSIGNQQNQALPANGAAIDVLAGVSRQIDYSGFISQYQNVPAYSAELQNLAGLSNSQILTKLLNVMYQEIRLSASAAAAAPQDQRYALYQQGFGAIKALFPDATYSGDLNMVFSQITTVMGGDINLAMPGGSMNVGLAGTQGGNQKTPDQLGILVQQQGALNILTKGDMNVNQSRVFTEGNGDITAWSSAGSIDAGKGARSALSASQPMIVYSADGLTNTSFTPAIAGSGIQAVNGGNVFLAAPLGVVNAGEAGISGRDIFIAAQTVQGLSNISSTGSTVGVPTVSVPVIGLGGADSAAAGASKTGTQSLAGENGNNADGGAKQKTSVTILTSDLLGFGKCSVSDVKNGSNGCGG